MTPWVKRLLLANVVMFVASGALPNLYREFAFVPALILQRPWTLVTYMFLHAGLWHLLFNMLGLFFFGPRLEALLGGRDFMKLYLVSGMGGALLSLFTPFAAVVGASGAVFGVLLGFALFWPTEPIYIWGVLPIQARILVIVIAVMSLYAGFGGARDGIAHFAHLGGFAGGFLYLKWRDWRRRARSYGPKRASAMQRVADEVRPESRRWEAIRRDQLHEINRSEVDRILAKIKATGLSSLTADERAFMDRMSSE